jgi:hypothetical protein
VARRRAGSNCRKAVGRAWHYTELFATRQGTIRLFARRLTRARPSVHARSYIKNDVLSVQESIVQHVEYSIGRTRYRFDDFEAYQARAHIHC